MNSCCRNSICNGNFNNNVLSANQNNNQLLSANNLNICNNNHCDREDNCTNDSFHETLCDCIGHRCSCEFQIHDNLETKTGILERVGSDFILLRSINNNRVMLCDTCNLRFITVSC